MGCEAVAASSHIRTDLLVKGRYVAPAICDGPMDLHREQRESALETSSGDRVMAAGTE